VRVTALLAHPDDELMCAGTLARLVNEGNEVTMVTLVVDGMRRPEWELVCKTLGVTPWAHWRGEEDEFVWSRRTVRQIEPILPETDLWITHRADDANTSHGHIGRLCQTFARKNKASIWEIDQSLPGGIVGAAPNLFVNVTDDYWRKERSFDAYESQHSRYPGWWEAIENRDRVYGWEIGVPFAEGFTVRKGVWL
jgi:LmbE family N-acetylglucosaminyl deacetylase